MTAERQQALFPEPPAPMLDTDSRALAKLEALVVFCMEYGITGAARQALGISLEDYQEWLSGEKDARSLMALGMRS